MTHHRFSPLKPAAFQKAPLIIAFDTEDNGKGAPDNFLCACFYSEEEGKRIARTREEAREYIFRSRGSPVIFFAHNLGYDLNNIDYPEGSVRQIYIKGRLIGGTFITKHKKKYRFMDTGNFFVGASLSELGEKVGVPKMEFNVLNLRGKSRKDLSMEELHDMEVYCMRDAEVCYKTAHSIVRLCMENQTRFRNFTASALAMGIFRSNYMESSWELRGQKINDIERLSYYGGRTEVFDHRRTSKVKYEDLVSSYPSAMFYKKFPYPGHYSRQRYLPWEEIRKLEGVCLAEVDVPKMHIPPLPYRRMQDGKLMFPIGRWTGAYTIPELRMAEKHGVRITVKDALLYDRMFSPFKDYIDHFFSMKKTSKGFERDFAKLMMNGLSGKFGQRSSFTLKGHRNNLEVCECPTKAESIICPICKLPNLERTDASDVMDLNGWVSMTLDIKRNDPPCAFPILIAYVTSYGRIKLYEDRLSRCDALYCDTDSCVSTDSPMDNLGPELGQWECKEYDSFEALAPKVYNYTNELHKAGMKLKGVPRKHRIVYVCERCETKKEEQEICCGIPMEMRYLYDKPMRLSEAIRRKMSPNSWNPVMKKIYLMNDKRVKLPSGRTNPIYISEKQRFASFEDYIYKAYGTKY